MPRVQWCISIVIYNKTSLYLPTLHTLSSHYTANTLQGAQHGGGILGGGGYTKLDFIEWPGLEGPNGGPLKITTVWKIVDSCPAVYDLNLN